MSNQLLRGELLLNQSEFTEFTKKLEKIWFDKYGLESSFIPWRLHPLDQTIRTHTPSSISLAAALRELDATVDPSLLSNQQIYRRSTTKQDITPTASASGPPSPVAVQQVVEVKDEPRHKVVDIKVEYDPKSDFYKLLHPGQDKLKHLPEWAKSIHKILKEICYQPYCKPFLKYFRNNDLNKYNINNNRDKDDNNSYNNNILDQIKDNRNGNYKKEHDKDKDDLDFDDMSDDLHDILMDLDQPVDKTDSVDQKLKEEKEEKMDVDNNNNKMDNKESVEKLDNYVKVEKEKDDTHNKTDSGVTSAKHDKDIDNKENREENNEGSEDNKESLVDNKEDKDKQDNKENREENNDEEDNKVEITIEYVLENLLSNKYENSSKVFSLLYGFLVDRFKELTPGSYDWMCAQDVSNKLDQLRINKGLNDAEWLSKYNQEISPISMISPVPSVGTSVQLISETQQSMIYENKKQRTSMEDFEHELSLINNVDEYSPTISLPEVKNITDQERMEFYENAVLLDTEYQLELFTVFEHAAVWKLVGNGEIELDDQNTDPKIYRGMIKWVKEKRSLCQNVAKDKPINLSQVSEITV